jgi:exosortase/archaeosortase family protein
MTAPTSTAHVATRRQLRVLHHRLDRRRRWAPLLGTFIAVLLVALLHERSEVRELEASVVGDISGKLLGEPVRVLGERITLASGHGDWLAFIVTPECSTVLLLVPFLVFCGLIATISLPPTTNWVSMLLIGTSGLCLVNVLRLTVIVTGTRAGSLAAYEFLHSGLGTVIVLAGASATLLICLRICFPRRRAVR